MYSNKYLTIDPLILQTLNLNEKRMNHILDILHGNPTKRNKKNNDNLSNLNKSQFVQNQRVSLPSIFKLKQNNEHNAKQIRKKSLIFRKQRNKSYEDAQEKSIQKVIQKAKKNPKKFFPISAKPSLETINRQLQRQMIPENKLFKKNQLINSYSTKQKRINKSKSQIIHPKDLYRLQIESILCDAIQINKLQQSQIRMKRVKRRHKHLQKFDKDYYSGLNQNELLLL